MAGEGSADSLQFAFAISPVVQTAPGSVSRVLWIGTSRGIVSNLRCTASRDSQPGGQAGIHPNH